MRGSACFRLLIGIILAQLWNTAPCETSAIIIRVLLPPRGPGRGVVELNILWLAMWDVIGVDVVVVGGGGASVVDSSLSLTL